MIIGNGILPGGTEDDWVLQQYLTKTLSEIYNEDAERVRNQGFASCSALTFVSLPNVTTIGAEAFSGCSALTSVSLPNATYIGPMAFSGCSALTAVSFPNATNIAWGAFADCSALTAFYLPSTSICFLGNVNAFQSTPLSGTGSGFIYVPASLVDSYKADLDWSEYASHITAI